MSFSELELRKQQEVLSVFYYATEFSHKYSKRDLQVKRLLRITIPNPIQSPMKISKFLRYLRFTRKEDEKSKAKPDDTASKSLFGKGHPESTVVTEVQVSTEKDGSTEKEENTDTMNDDEGILSKPYIIDPFGPLNQPFEDSLSSPQKPNYPNDMLMPSSVPPGPYTKRRLIKITRRLTSTEIDGKVTRQVIEFPQ